VIEFILNNTHIQTQSPSGLSLLDFIRENQQLKSTKIGCREGDCGACTVLEGSIVHNQLVYKSIVSCLTPLINVQSKHIVSLEGLNMPNLSIVQQIMKDNAASQCGFCTPGFVVALTSHLIEKSDRSSMDSIGGNICRCTGYKSIHRAAIQIDEIKKSLLLGSEIQQMVQKAWLPEYFLEIESRIKDIKTPTMDISSYDISIGGGTDLMVQNLESVRKNQIRAIANFVPSNIKIENNCLIIGGAVSITDFIENHLILKYFKNIKEKFYLIASRQIRNMGSLAGNIVNASPIGDLSLILLALNAELVLVDHSGNERTLNLSDFFIAYKQIDLKDEELIKYIQINNVSQKSQINFEKVSKRTYLDIASVNTAISIQLKAGAIEEIYISAGGLSPIPMLLNKTMEFLGKKLLNLKLLEQSLDIIQSEISPINDIRGSKVYKRLLIRQLFLQHFLQLFPDIFSQDEVYNLMINNTVEYEKY